MSDFRVVIGSEPGRTFERPHAVLRAVTPAQANASLADAQDALRDGYWLAGILNYELGEALEASPSPEPGELLTLGVFDPPQVATPPARDHARISPLLPLFARAAYDDAIAAIARAIYDGDVYQVNLTVPFAFAYAGHPHALYAKLAAQSRAPYAAMVEDATRAVLSFSPELFLAFDGDGLTAKPMKGTASLDRLEELDSQKNRAEHVMIVDLLRNDLHRICDEVAVERLFEVELHPTFATMTSTIVGKARPGTTFGEIVRATFPCGSVTGAPKRAAMAQIARLEPNARRAYCGSIGYLSPQRRGWWNVAIRTAQLNCERSIGRWDAGGGIVSDSNASDEWDEIALKSRFFAEGAQPFDLRETFAGGDAGARDAHLRRLQRTASAFGVAYDDQAVRAAIASHDEPKRLLRLRLHSDGRAVVASEALEPVDEPVRVCIAGVRVFSDDPMLAWKTSWRAVYERAAATARRRGCFEGLLLNESGRVTEGSRTTIFARVGATTYTPPLADGVLPGILRARALAQGLATEGSLFPDDLRSADELFIGNSARGMLRAVLIEDHDA